MWSQRGHETTTLRGHEGRVNACDLFVRMKKKLRRVEETEISDLWADRVDEAEQAKSKEALEVEEVLLVSAGDDGKVRVWRPAESESVWSLEGHNGEVKAVAMKSTGLVVTGSADRSTSVWDVGQVVAQVETGRLIEEKKRGHVAEVTCMCVSGKNWF